jgi:hypothetical protein
MLLVSDDMDEPRDSHEVEGNVMLATSTGRREDFRIDLVFRASSREGKISSVIDGT